MPKCELEGFEDFAFIQYPPITPVTETREYFTEVIEMHDGGEVRKTLRQYPREVLQFDYTTDIFKTPEISNTIEQAIRGKWLVPIWHEATLATPTASNRVYCETEGFGANVGSLVFVFHPSRGYRICKLLQIEPGVLTIDTEEPVPQNSAIMPMRQAVLLGDGDRNAGGFSGELSLKFALTDSLFFRQKAGIVIVANRQFMGHDDSAMHAEFGAIVSTIAEKAIEHNLQIDLGLVGFPGLNSQTFIDATVFDIQSGINFAYNLPNTSSAMRADRALEYINGFFRTVAPNPGDRKDVVIFITDSGCNAPPENFAEIQDILDGTGDFAGSKSVLTKLFAYPNTYNGTVNDIFNDVFDNSPDGWQLCDPINTIAEYAIDVLQPYIEPPEYNVSRWLSLPFASPGEIPRVIYQSYDTADYEVGKFVIRSTWAESKRRTQINGAASSVSEWRDFLRFFDAHKGKAGEFLMPSFESEVRLVSVSPSRLEIVCQNDGFDLFGSGRERLAFRFTDGTWQFRNIASVSTNTTGNKTITLDVAIANKAVEYVSYAGKWRFESDTLEAKWVDNGVAEFSFGLIEVKKK